MFRIIEDGLCVADKMDSPEECKRWLRDEYLVLFQLGELPMQFTIKDYDGRWHSTVTFSCQVEETIL